MEGLFAAVNAVLSFVTPVSDFFWDFPKMFGFWQAIPLLGQFSLAIIVLVGSGLYFTFRLGFIQIQCFPVGCFLSEYGHACGAGKYYRSDRSDCRRRPGGAFLDVGIRVFRYGDCLYGKYPGTDIQGEAGERICGRPSILCAVSLREQSVDWRGIIAGLYRICHDVPACTGL